MTEQLFPDDVANGLVDGTLPIDEIPADVRATADVLRAAHQAATSEELSGMAATVQRFTAAVTAPATTHRSSPMFATRLTRRAATMVAVTLLAAGTAAASAGGALPSFGSGGSQVAAPRVEDELSTTMPAEETTTTEVGEDTTTTAVVDDATTSPSTTVDAAAPLVPPEQLDEMQAANPSLFGKCTAWTNGAQKNPEVPGFAELQVAADEVGLTIDEFCDELLAAHDGTGDADTDDETDSDGDTDTDNDSDESDDDADDSDNGNGQGNGNGNGNGNGKGKGKNDG